MEPQDKALLKMLFSLPEKWAEYKWDDFTGTEQKVLKRIVAAGLVEEKIGLHCNMEGFSDEVQFQVYRRGDYTQGQLKEAIFKAMPKKWLDTKGRTKGKYECEVQNSFQARLTDQGALAKHDYENEKPSFVLHLVEKLSEPGVIRICAGLKRVKCDSRNRSETGQEKKVAYTGVEAWEKMWEKFLEYGRYTIPEKPFAGRPIKITDNNYDPSDGYRELLTEDEQKKLRKVLPQLSDAGLEAVLRRVYNMGDERTKDLTWKQIFEICTDYINSQNSESTDCGKTTQYDRFIKWCKNNRFICFILIIIIIVIGLGQFTDAYNKIRDSWFKPNSLPKHKMNDSSENGNVLKPNGEQIEVEGELDEQTYLSPVYKSFKTDSSHTLRVSKTMFTIADTNNKIETQLHIDFNGGSVFISLYIPSSPKTYEICKEMTNHYDSILELQNNTVEVQSHLPGEKPIEMKDLKFSGRIFIYHEYPIFESKLNDLVSLYKSKNLQLQCRSTEYSYHQQKTEQDN